MIRPCGSQGLLLPQGLDAPLRRIRFPDLETETALIFLTNHFTLPAFTITERSRCRGQVELFFKWIKPPLRSNACFGTSEHAVKSQLWIAVSGYVLVAIVKKRRKISASLYDILQILSLTMCERIPFDHVLAQGVPDDIRRISDKPLILFDSRWDTTDVTYLPNPPPVRIFNEMGPPMSTALTLLYCKDQIVAGRNDATDEECGVQRFLYISEFG